MEDKNHEVNIESGHNKTLGSKGEECASKYLSSKGKDYVIHNVIELFDNLDFIRNIDWGLKRILYREYLETKIQRMYIVSDLSK